MRKTILRVAVWAIGACMILAFAIMTVGVLQQPPAAGKLSWLEFIVGMTGALAWPATVLILLGVLYKPIIDLLPFLKELKGPGGFEAKFDRILTNAETTLDAPIAATDRISLADLAAEREHRIEANVESAVVALDDSAPSRGAMPAPEPVSEPASEESAAAIATNAMAVRAREGAHLAALEAMADLMSTKPFSKSDLLALKNQPAGVVMEAWTALEDAGRALRPSISALGRRLDWRDLAKTGRIRSEEMATIKQLQALRNTIVAVPDATITPDQAARFKVAADQLARRFIIRATTKVIKAPGLDSDINPTP